MTNIIYTAAVLGSLCDDRADMPGIIANVLAKLSTIDVQLTRFAQEEDKSGIDHTDESEALMAEAAKVVARLSLSHTVELFYDDSLPEGAKGPLRLEIPGTAWDAAAPLLLS